MDRRVGHVRDRLRLAAIMLTRASRRLVYWL